MHPYSLARVRIIEWVGRIQYAFHNYCQNLKSHREMQSRRLDASLLSLYTISAVSVETTRTPFSSVVISTSGCLLWSIFFKVGNLFKKRWRDVYFGRSRNFLNHYIPFDRLVKSRKRSGRHQDGASKVSVNGAYTTKHFNVVVVCTLYRCMEVWIREGRGVYTVKLRFRMVFEIFWEMFLWKMNFSIL